MLQFSCEGVCGPSSPAGNNMGVWTVCCQWEYCRVCLALHHLQFPSGTCACVCVCMCNCETWSILYNYTEFLYSHLQGLFIFIFHVVRNERVSNSQQIAELNLTFLLCCLYNRCGADSRSTMKSIPPAESARWVLYTVVYLCIDIKLLFSSHRVPHPLGSSLQNTIQV